MKKPVHKVPTTWHKMETSFYREPNKSENINPNKTLSGPTAQRREPWETRCLFTHDGTGGGQHSDNSLRDRRPAATPGSSLQAVTTKYWGLTSKRRRHGAIYPGTVWRVVTWQRRGTNWVYWLRSRDHRGARPQQLPPPSESVLEGALRRRQRPFTPAAACSNGTGYDH